ncbi:MEDOS 2 [Hibiscus trionum]|uniref:non-specific serine/threonine protein kinase n=1 Tax=Hibiscus trionum TaxID=183268 RepID=A0A9W7GVZ9_HIBTR|nr:MEDOS 2 [Hibiscus trionum]
MKNPLRSLLCFSVSNKKPPQQLPDGLCRHFSLAQIQAATNNFNADSLIGKRDLETVYKGTANDGAIVAVLCWQRKNRPYGYDAGQFQNEVLFLCQLRHPHLVSLIGICGEGNERIQVYEYTSRGSLSDHLFGEGYAPLLWKQRLQICIGAARGLHYLHTGAKYAVIHRDIRTSNILLDEEFSSKLSGFGLSKLGPPSMSKTLIRKETRVAGTLEYMAPEYAMLGELTEKSDVYSFGVVLLEVLFGRAAYDRTLPQNQSSIFDWTYESLREGTIYHAIDPHLKGRIAPECLDKYFEIAYSCVRPKGNERPAMGEVEVTLELALELQDRADAEMQAINPCGECMYEEALFSTFSRKFTGPDIHHDSSRLSDSENNNSNNKS